MAVCDSDNSKSLHYSASIQERPFLAAAMVLNRSRLPSGNPARSPEFRLSRCAGLIYSPGSWGRSSFGTTPWKNPFFSLTMQSMSIAKLKTILSHPMSRRLYWVIYAFLFYNAGLALTIWLLEPENFAGGWDWFWLALSPFLIPGFFIVNRYLGCTTGQCASGQCAVDENEKSGQYKGRMPGM